MVGLLSSDIFLLRLSFPIKTSIHMYKEVIRFIYSRRQTVVVKVRSGTGLHRPTNAQHGRYLFTSFD